MRNHPQTRFSGQRFNLRQGEFVGVFGMNHFPSREIEGFVQSFNMYLLDAGAYQEGTHGPIQRTIISVVLPMSEVKISPQLAVEAGE